MNVPRSYSREAHLQRSGLTFLPKPHWVFIQLLTDPGFSGGPEVTHAAPIKDDDNVALIYNSGALPRSSSGRGEPGGGWASGICGEAPDSLLQPFLASFPGCEGLARGGTPWREGPGQRAEATLGQARPGQVPLQVCG